MKWEVVFDIEPFLSGREREEKVHEELWNETFHHLAGSSILHDFEHMADKESEIEQGEFGGTVQPESKMPTLENFSYTNI